MKKKRNQKEPMYAYAERLVLETEGRRGGAVRGWYGEVARLLEEEREYWEIQAHESRKDL
jgi:hypothetical protein